MSDIKGLFEAIARGDSRAAAELFSLLYEELRQIARSLMARERANHTLQPTELVHEAWARLCDEVDFENRAHFFGAAAQAMRRILVDHARRKVRQKGGGGAVHLDLDGIEIAAPTENHAEVLEVHEALDRLAKQHPRKADLVKLRYFVGLSFKEAAAMLGISEPTANRDWAYARAWLHQEITGGSAPEKKNSTG